MVKKFRLTVYVLCLCSVSCNRRSFDSNEFASKARHTIVSEENVNSKFRTGMNEAGILKAFGVPLQKTSIDSATVSYSYTLSYNAGHLRDSKVFTGFEIVTENDSAVKLLPVYQYRN